MRPRSPRSRSTVVAVAIVAAMILSSAAVTMGAFDRALPGGVGGRRSAMVAIVAYGIGALLLVALARLWKRKRAAALAAVLAVVVPCVAFDVALRFVRVPAGTPKVANMGMLSPTLHHRYPANATLRLGNYRGEALVFSTNEDGLRSRYSRAEFVARPRRIACLGDSFTFGLGVTDEEPYPQRLEALLDERAAGGFAVLNAGVVSYSPMLERAQFEEVVRHYEPELVLLMLDVTDVGDDLKYEREAIASSVEGGGRPTFPFDDAAASFVDLGPLWNLAQPLRKAFAFPFVALERRLGDDSGYRPYRFDLAFGDARETDQFFHYRHPLDETRPYFERTWNNVVEVARAVAGSGARFALVLIPRYTHWNPKECPNNWETAYALDEPHQFAFFDYFRAKATEAPFPVLDLLPAFEATDAFPLVFDDDPHWNAAGHAFVAETLAAELAASGMLND